MREKAVAAFVTALVEFDGFATGLPARDTWPYPHVLQCFSEPVRIIAPAGRQPLRGWQAAQQGRRAGVVTDRTASDEEPDRAAIGIGHGMQFGVHATPGAPDQTPAPLFFTPRLEPCGVP